MIDMDVRDVIHALGVPMMRRRFAGDGYDAEGFGQPSTPTEVELPLVVWEPSSGNALMRLRPGQRTQETRTIYVPEDDAAAPALRAASVSGSHKADQIQISGVWWEVKVLHHFEQGCYYEALVQRVGRG